VINVDDLDKLKNGKLAESEALILDEISLNSTWIDLIQWCCPNLKYLFIKYSCKCAATKLYLKRFLCVEMFMKISMLNVTNRLSIELPSNLEKFTAHISRIDPVTSKTISGEYKGRINLTIKTLKKLQFL
jgi:hypothetical protein